MQQEQDTCRICSGPGEPDQPLFYPCKCSGTIRYIHQDCLKTWLDHSKKSTCDVCKHPYAFTKVYAPDMPDRVPMSIIVRKFAEQVIAVVLFMLRATLVAFVWLTLLPYGTVLTWRLYFRMGDILAWWISLHPRPIPRSSHARSAPNGTVHTSSNDSMPLNGSTPIQQPLSDVFLQPFLRSVSTDIFTGQIIASLIVLAFLAIFLLREWIQQNARPGVFDDGPAAEAPAPVDRQQQAEPPEVEAGPADVDNDEDPGSEDDEPQRAPDDPELVPAALALAARPVPDVPEDVRPAGPSSSSSSSSDTEGPPPRPAPSAHMDERLPPFNRRRQEMPKRRVRGAAAARKRRALDGEDPEMENSMRPRRIKRNERGSSQWESQTSDPSSSRRPSRSGLYALEGGPRSGMLDSNMVDQGYASGLGGNSEAMFPLDSKARQKRKVDDSDTEVSSRHSSPPSPSPRPARRSLSPSSDDFKFTFKPPASSSNGMSAFPATFALPQKGEFKLRPRARSFSQPTPSSSSTAHFSSSTQPSSPKHSSLGFDYPNGIDMFPSVYSAPGVRRSVFDLPLPEEDNRGALAELPYPLTPRSSAPPSTPSNALLFTTAPVEPTPYSFPSSPQSRVSPSPPRMALTLRRPPLPTSTVSAAEHINAEASSSSIGAVAASPLPSPRLVIYRPPEELEVEDGEYFSAGHARAEERDAEEEEEDEDDDDARFAYYFREPEQEDAREMPPPLLPDTDDEEEEDVHDVEEPQVGVAAEPPEDIPPVAGGAAGQNIDADIADDERDQNLEEDLDGAMEAVGLRGPVFAVFQNAALMLFILNVSIGGGVWIPFTLGKTIALLTLEPRRALQIIHLPIRAVRLVTDPSVDAVIYCLRLLGFSLVAWSKVACVRVLHLIGTLFGADAEKWISALSGRVDLQYILSLFTLAGNETVSASQTTGVASWTIMGEELLSYVRSATQGENSTVSTLAISISELSLFRLAEESFAVLGRQVRLAFGAALKEWVELAEGDGTMERVWAILLGYAIAAFLAALYLNTITVGNVKSAGRAVRNAIRQQMIVLKVALFIIVELVMFPFGCGVMLDFSTLVLFPEATVESRVGFFLYAPVTAMFYHWLIGTMFMYQFAILLATCREILRPGCMWFIKDPQDPTFHPIRDILDRPTFAQLRKLCMSAMMYGVVISLGVGSMVWSLTAIAPSILPLRWKMREPLSEVPVDLLFVHLILPPTLYYFRPRKPVRRLMTTWWQWAARQLRLTSFMFGGRHPDEEFKPMHWSWRALLTGYNEQPAVIVTAQDGGFRRAPAGDNIAFLRDRPALVEVDENGEPLDSNGRDIILAQNAEAHQAGRNVRDDYTVVYVPPNFRRRIILFILLFWITGSFAVVLAAAVPILSGRAVFKLFTPRELHDGYSFVVGFYLLWWAWLVGSLMIRIRIRRQRHGGGRRIRAGWFLFLLKRVSVYVSKILWLVFWLGVVLPTLVSIAVDLYLVIPLRFFMNPDFVPTIHVVESWATGLIISKIIIRTQRTRPGNDLSGALEALQRNGWRRPDPWAATRDFIIPVGTGLLGMILLPPLVVYWSSRLISIPWKSEELVRLIYPSIFVTVAASQFAMSLVGVFVKWTQGIRDKEFLVELRLRNLDNPRKPDKMEPSVVEFIEDQEEVIVGGED